MPHIISQTKTNFMNATTTTAQIYVSTYAKYNNGSLYGEWVDLSKFLDADDFMEYIAELHNDEEDPEFMFQDYEGFPECYYSESLDVDTLSKLYEYINLDEDEKKIVEMYADATGYSINDIDISDAKNAFHGTADSEADFAERMAEDCGDIPSDLPSWIVIDWKASWDCNLRYDYMTATDTDGGIYFFRND